MVAHWRRPCPTAAWLHVTPGARSCCQPITPAIPTTGSSGGTTPATSTRPTAGASAISSRSSASAIERQPVNPSRWAVRDLYMAHFALTDVGASACSTRAKLLSRQGIGWAGARTDTYSVWNGGWTARIEDGVHRLEAADRTTGLRLSTRVRGRQARRAERIPGIQPEGAGVPVTRPSTTH